jgi:hypothetical protein
MADTFLERNCISLGKTLVADGTSEVLTAVEDMSGYDEITFLILHGDVDAAAVMTYTVKENTASSTSSPSPTTVTGTVVTGTGATISTGALTITESSGNLDNKILAITVSHSALSKRYVFLSITCATESHEINAIITIKGRPKSLPVSHASDVVATLQAAS